MSRNFPVNVIEDPALRDQSYIFHDRRHAAAAIVTLLSRQYLPRPLVLGIPSGGAPVAAEIARALNGDLDVIIARKLQLPWNPEAGFGACTLDGPVYLNPAIVSAAGLSPHEIDEVEQRTRTELRRRDRLYRDGRPMPVVNGRNLIIADDGLASGVTMMAAVSWAREHEPAKLIVAVPTGHLESVVEMSRFVDLIVCPNIRGGYSFAVAQAYQSWSDLGKEEVLAALNEFRLEEQSDPGPPGSDRDVRT